MVIACSACGSKRLARMLVGLEWWRWRVGLYAPGGGRGRRKADSALRAVACVDCGNVQLVAADLEAVSGLYESQRRDSLQLEP